MAYEIHTLDLGSVEIDASRAVQHLTPGRKLTLPVYAFLLLGGETPVVVDTGFREAAIMGRIGMRAFETPEQRLAARLAEHGLAPADVGLVLQTHLHIDHAGQTDIFPMETTVVVNRRELEYAVSGLSGASYPPEDVKHVIDRLHTKDALRLLDLELTGPEEVAPGIECVLAGGHTEGMMAVHVDTAMGRAVICGDIIYSVEHQLLAGTDRLAAEPVTTGNYVGTRRAERAAIKRALRAADVLVPSHDTPVVIERGRVAGRLGPTIPGPLLPV